MKATNSRHYRQLRRLWLLSFVSRSRSTKNTPLMTTAKNPACLMQPRLSGVPSREQLLANERRSESLRCKLPFYLDLCHRSSSLRTRSISSGSSCGKLGGPHIMLLEFRPADGREFPIPSVPGESSSLPAHPPARPRSLRLQLPRGHRSPPDRPPRHAFRARVLPEMPVCAAITVCSPICTLCAT